MFSMRNQETYTGLTVVDYTSPQLRLRRACALVHAFPSPPLLAAVLKVALPQIWIFITDLKLFQFYTD